ncbi:hypothetical protein GQ44DRAFT_709171 [Phaeosphaeriaceae sp. PMI808]|nr:hypothetical protein GQ44DRAFT_709171 [Phaeosphaeriaceae sp. PMI808]
MPEVGSTSIYLCAHEGSNAKSQADQPNQTKDGDYEFLRYYTFEAVNYERFMSWKAGSGRIGVGISEITSRGTNKDMENVKLPSGHSVIVMDTNFKLASKV